jgi:hypothetical protein
MTIVDPQQGPHHSGPILSDLDVVLARTKLPGDPSPHRAFLKKAALFWSPRASCYSPNHEIYGLDCHGLRGAG